MSDRDKENKAETACGPGYGDSCPVCEHADPQLEGELQAFAQLLFEIHVARCAEQGHARSRTTIDNRS